MDFELVMVEWLDSAERDPNVDLFEKEFPEPQLIHQAGFLVQDNDSYVVIAGAIKPPALGDGEDSFDYVIAIPKFAIREMTTLAPMYDTQEGD
tara:strand:+ start:127 stop:405 length:279 start_codon:yes stop_codon:yes gene_type:complete